MIPEDPKQQSLNKNNEYKIMEIALTEKVKIEVLFKSVNYLSVKLMPNKINRKTSYHSLRQHKRHLLLILEFYIGIKQPLSKPAQSLELNFLLRLLPVTQNLSHNPAISHHLYEPNYPLFLCLN